MTFASLSTSSSAGPAAALASAAIWSFASTRYTQSSRIVGSAGVNLTRVLVVFPCFLVATWFFVPTHFAAVTRTHALWLLASVLCSYGGADLLFFAAARRLGISSALAIASSYPLWAAAWGVLFDHEALTVGRVFGTLLCIGGIVALVLFGRAATLEKQRWLGTGALLALATSLLWAGNSVSTKAGATGLSPWLANCVRYIFALPILLGLHFSQRNRPSLNVTFRALIGVSFLEAFCGSSLFVYGLSHSDLAVGSTLSSLGPLFAVPLAVLLREEPWSTRRAVAVVATVAGVVILVHG